MVTSIEAIYVDHMGSDITVVNSARVSFDKESNFELGRLSARDTKLIKYLADHNHFTPFTHPQITIRETVPIFVARQRFKHTVGFTYNEISRRYVSNTPDFYTPDNWRSKPDGSIKQGSGGEHPSQLVISESYEKHLRTCVNFYETLIAEGVAPEQARMVLPQSTMTSYYVTGSLAAFARMYRLRNEPSAQNEIQCLAKKISDIVAPLYPVSWEALVGVNYV